MHKFNLNLSLDESRKWGQKDLRISGLRCYQRGVLAVARVSVVTGKVNTARKITFLHERVH